MAVLSGSLTRAAVCLAVLALSGCKIFVKEEPPPCPRVSVLEDASKLINFRPGSQEAKDVEMRAEIVKYQGSCYYDRDAKTMQVSFSVGIDAFAGPAFVEGPHQVEYFVAIPAFMSDPEAKKIFPLALDIPRDPKGTHVDDTEVDLTFPVKNLKELTRYEIFVGFQLDKAQLDYNRKHDYLH